MCWEVIVRWFVSVLDCILGCASETKILHHSQVSLDAADAQRLYQLK